MLLDRVLADVIDELATATNEASFVAVGRRAVRRLGFQSFAYLSFAHPRLAFLSSYPREWTGHYVRSGYERIDPVVRQARKSRVGFYRDGSRPAIPTTSAQSRFFREASEFGINNGLTVPIHGGFGQLAAFTLAAEDRDPSFSRYASEALDTLHLLVLYYHAYVRAKLQLGLSGFRPWRRDVRWEAAQEAPIAPLLPRLGFSAGKKNWGQQLRFGLLPIRPDDFALITATMRHA